MTDAKTHELLQQLIASQARTHELLAEISTQLAFVIQNQDEALTSSADIATSLRTSPADPEDDGESYLQVIADEVAKLARAAG